MIHKAYIINAIPHNDSIYFSFTDFVNILTLEDKKGVNFYKNFDKLKKRLKEYYDNDFGDVYPFGIDDFGNNYFSIDYIDDLCNSAIEIEETDIGFRYIGYTKNKQNKVLIIDFIFEER